MSLHPTFDLHVDFWNEESEIDHVDFHCMEFGISDPGNNLVVSYLEKKTTAHPDSPDTISEERRRTIIAAENWASVDFSLEEYELVEMHRNGSE